MWNNVLPQSGFRGVDIMLDSFAEYKEAAVIFARTIEAPVPRTLPASKEVTLVNIPLIPFQLNEMLRRS